MLLYDIAISLYDLAAYVLFPFSRKPRKMVKGHWVVYDILRQQRESDADYVWFHAASLGEFEQGRPLIEEIRRRHPDKRILLTFFSPSGYEVRKHYDGADIVCYLPFDKPRNVRKFLDLARPSMAFFIKYEFWKNYLDELKRRGIPAYSVSSVFRKDQVFFKWYGTLYRKVLQDFTRLYVQNELSKRYLAKIGIDRVTIVGDTRFDRVLDIMRQAKELPLLESFKGDSPVIVAGSSWQPDEDLLIEYFNTHPGFKLIIAPHVIDELHLVEISYGEIAYVGGGFGAGIHNILEAAVYGMPVIFGPKYQKFVEARELIEARGAFPVTDYASLSGLLDRLRSDGPFLQSSGETARRYVHGHAGATLRVLEDIGL